LPLRVLDRQRVGLADETIEVEVLLHREIGRPSFSFVRIFVLMCFVFPVFVWFAGSD
jgi:hypothetical protein